MVRTTRIYKASKWIIEFAYEVSNKETKLLYVRIAPIYPFEAELLASEAGINIAWSYEKPGTIIIHGGWVVKDSREFERKIIESLSKIIPGFSRACNIEYVTGELRQRSWVVHIIDQVLEARKKIDDIILEILAVPKGLSWSKVWVKITAFPKGLNESEKLREKIVKLGGGVYASFPVLKARISIGDIFNVNIIERIEEIIGTLVADNE